MNDALIIIPTFNEIENIENIIESIFKLYPNINILIVDDNSPDKTSLKVKELKKNYGNKLLLEVRLYKRGLGSAYTFGFEQALTKDFKYIFEMDADFSHNPRDIKTLYDSCSVDNYDFSIGSRYISGINVVNWPLYRIILSYAASFYVRIITGMNIKDPTSGFICYKREVLENINLKNIKFIGYAFQIEMKYKAFLKNFNYTEIPIIFSDRKYGKSKLNSNIIFEAIFGVIKMKLYNLFNIKF